MILARTGWNADGKSGIGRCSSMVASTIQSLASMVAYAVSDRLLKLVEYLQEGVGVPRETLVDATGTTGIRCTPDRRRRLAIKGKALTFNEHVESRQILRSATILACFRQLTTHAYDSTSNRRAPGRPRKPKDTLGLVVCMAREHLGWGYTKNRNAPCHFHVEIERTAVAAILREAGLKPAHDPTGKRTWKHFLASHCFHASDRPRRSRVRSNF
jgi:transposase